MNVIEAVMEVEDFESV